MKVNYRARALRIVADLARLPPGVNEAVDVMNEVIGPGLSDWQRARLLIEVVAVKRELREEANRLENGSNGHSHTDESSPTAAG